MVYALQECWRVLAPGGCLIDLRPLAGNSPVEVITAEQTHLAGRIDDSRDLLDDQAAAAALAQVGEAGWFVLEREERFPYISFWDTAEEMRHYIEQKRSSLILPPEVLNEAQRLLVSKGSGARLRIPFTLIIARYRKTLKT